MRYSGSSTYQLLTRAEYYAALSQADANECSFCSVRDQLVLHETANWVWIASLAPYFKFHTIFVPKQHLVSLHCLNQSEFDDYKTICAFAEARYRQAKLAWEDGTPISVYTYSWRYRHDGIDATHNVKKSMHLHIHMWPERDGLMTSVTDPAAHTWDPEIFKS